MKFTHLFNKPTEKQQKVFDLVSPKVEHVFPKATAWIDTRNNQINFDCGHRERPEPHREVCFPPDEEELYTLCDELNDKFKDINFHAAYEDFGVAVPMFIIATW